MYIAIDTSTDYAGLALVKDGRIIAEMDWRCGQDHTLQLLPGLSFLLEQQKVDMSSAEGLIVARGPGSYNGLRVGLSTAKGLAFSLNIPVVGISTLEAEAYQHAERELPVCAVFNAGRGEIAAAVFRKQNGDWGRLVAEHITTVEVLCSDITEPTVFCGEYVPAISAAISEKLRERAIFVSPAGWLRRSGYLAELGSMRFASRDYDDASTLQPLYLRAPSITQPKRP